MTIAYDLHITDPGAVVPAAQYYGGDIFDWKNTPSKWWVEMQARVLCFFADGPLRRRKGNHEGQVTDAPIILAGSRGQRIGIAHGHGIFWTPEQCAKRCVVDDPKPWWLLKLKKIGFAFAWLRPLSVSKAAQTRALAYMQLYNLSELHVGHRHPRRTFSVALGNGRMLVVHQRGINRIDI